MDRVWWRIQCFFWRSRCSVWRNSPFWSWYIQLRCSPVGLEDKNWFNVVFDTFVIIRFNVYLIGIGLNTMFNIVNQNDMHGERWARGDSEPKPLEQSRPTSCPGNAFHSIYCEEEKAEMIRSYNQWAFQDHPSKNSSLRTDEKWEAEEKMDWRATASESRKDWPLLMRVSWHSIPFCSASMT